MRKIAIIGGTGIADPSNNKTLQPLVIQTPFGPAKCYCGEMAGNQVAFLSRHGLGHVVPPSKVNYRANIWALKSLGVEEIFATTAVGSLNRTMEAGDFVVCDQILDFTKNRINTFYNGEGQLVAHADFTNPYCPRLRKLVQTCLQDLKIKYHAKGCYVCTEGPRFETAAEIKMYALMGGDLVGMTNMPEAILAREAEMCYVNCSLVTNAAAGISDKLLSHEEVLTAMQKMSAKMNELIAAFIKAPEDTASCTCAHTMREFGGFQLNSFSNVK